MCLIIHKPANVVLTKEQLEPVYDRNSDGFGLMYLEKDTVKTVKILPKNISQVMETLEPHMNKELGIHFRMQTHGKINLENAHPYQIFNKEEGAPFDAYLMHNGVLGSFTTNTTEHSDTYNFIEEFIKPLIKSDGYSIVNTTTFQRLLDEKISSSNRLLILTDKGFTIINEKAGTREKIPSTWCSNTYAFGSTTTTTTTYRSNYYQPVNRYEWGFLPHWIEQQSIDVDEPKKADPPKMATVLGPPPKPPETKKEELNAYVPGIGAYDYTELKTLRDTELFALIIENPEDVFDLISDHLDAIIDAIDEDMFAESINPEDYIDDEEDTKPDDEDERKNPYSLGGWSEV